MCPDGNFLPQVPEPVRRSHLQNLIVTKEEGFTGDMKMKGSLGCRDHEMVEFRILGAGRSKRRLTTLDFKRTDFGVFKYLCGGVTRESPQVKTGARKLGNILGWDNLLQAYERSIPTSMKMGKMPGGLHG